MAFILKKRQFLLADHYRHHHHIHPHHQNQGLRWFLPPPLVTTDKCSPSIKALALIYQRRVF